MSLYSRERVSRILERKAQRKVQEDAIRERFWVSKCFEYKACILVANYERRIIRCSKCTFRDSKDAYLVQKELQFCLPYLSLSSSYTHTARGRVHAYTHSLSLSLFLALSWNIQKIKLTEITSETSKTNQGESAIGKQKISFQSKRENLVAKDRKSEWQILAPVDTYICAVVTWCRESRPMMRRRCVRKFLQRVDPCKCSVWSYSISKFLQLKEQFVCNKIIVLQIVHFMLFNNHHLLPAYSLCQRHAKGFWNPATKMKSFTCSWV